MYIPNVNMQIQIAIHAFIVASLICLCPVSYTHLTLPTNREV